MSVPAHISTKIEGEDEETIEIILDENPIEEVLRKYQIVPSAITTTGARLTK